MVKMPPWMIERLEVDMSGLNGSGNTTQPVGTHSCVDPLVNECKFASKRNSPRSSPVIIPDTTFGNVGADAISAHKACSPPMVLMATLPSSIAKPTVDNANADVTEPVVIGTHKVLEKRQINVKPPKAKPKQMSSSDLLAKDVPAVPRDQVRPRDVSSTQFSVARGLLRSRNSSLSDEHRNKRHRHCEPAKASALVKFGEAIRRELRKSGCTLAPVGDRRPMLPVPPPAPLSKPAARLQCQGRGQVTITAPKASTLQSHSPWSLPKPPPPDFTNFEA